MTIDDFITTYKSYAKDYRKETYNTGYSTQQRDYARDKAREYEQLADWLEELKAMRNLDKTNFSEGYDRGRADAIDECKYKIVDSLEKQLGCKVCSGYEEKYHCSTCVNQKIINSTVDILEQLKEQKNDNNRVN